MDVCRAFQKHMRTVCATASDGDFLSESLSRSVPVLVMRIYMPQLAEVEKH